ncbi:Ger(x)C family spore germination protein [Paenibacillus daejeonensis]|uniref:Ger(x)C family spore germination protein n=1 Tax=Paenibacillus daejeonensis TaxID=135193 RepID=UPI000380E9F2|nr:Ger(x)C family spore germination protein [Paenibacillus daejeonensis]
MNGRTWRITSWCKRLTKTALLLVALLPLTGCWDVKEVQYINYITACGIDYVDGEFITYVQALDFSAISSSVNGVKQSGEPGVWVGKGTGKTLNTAFNSLFKTSQQTVSWGHTTAYVLTERALKNRDLQLFETISRYQDTRNQAWYFGTQENLEELLLATPFYKQTPLVSILHEPESTYVQQSVLPPQTLLRYMSESREPGMTTYLPTLALNKTQWNENGKPHPMLFIDGAFFLTGEQWNGWLSRDQLYGYQWLNKQTVTAPMLLEDQPSNASVQLDKPKFTIHSYIEADTMKFRIKVKLTGTLLELDDDMETSQVEKLASHIVKDSILKVYREGIAIQADVLRLGDRLYRKQPDTWRKLTSNGQRFALKEDSIASLEVNVNLRSAGRYKLPDLK